MENAQGNEMTQKWNELQAKNTTGSNINGMTTSTMHWYHPPYHPGGVCPNCGHCPHCGRGPSFIPPSYPYYPMWPYSTMIKIWM